MRVTHWGNEIWKGGKQSFKLVLGDGRPILLHGLWGGVSVSQTANWVYGQIHQALVSIWAPEYPGDQIQETNLTGGPANDAAGPVLLMVNPKLVGDGSLYVPIVNPFPGGVAIGNTLQMDISNDNQGPIVDGNYLDVEVHLTVGWDYILPLSRGNRMDDRNHGVGVTQILTSLTAEKRNPHPPLDTPQRITNPAPLRFLTPPASRGR